MNIRRHYIHRKDNYASLFIVLTLLFVTMFIVFIACKFVLAIYFTIAFFLCALCFYFVKYLYFRSKVSAANREVAVSQSAETQVNEFMIIKNKQSLAFYNRFGNIEQTIRKKRAHYFLSTGKHVSYGAFAFELYSDSMSMYLDAFKSVFDIKQMDKQSICFEQAEAVFNVSKKQGKLSISKNGVQVARIQKGWMHIQEQKKFPINTPVLIRNEHMEDQDMPVVMAVIFYFYYYYVR